MAKISKIQWTDATWNIAVGCTKVDKDCEYCYMYRGSRNGTRYDPRRVVRTKTVFNMPLKYKRTASECHDGPPLIFTSSQTDVFHEAIDGYRNEMWDIIRQCPHLIFQVLTKRPERILANLPEDWGSGWKNVWLGTSIGSSEDKAQKRGEDLVKIKDAFPDVITFLSMEPLWQKAHIPVDYSDGSPMVDWVIVGGESGNETGKYLYRECKLEWIESIVQECQGGVGCPVFVKQLGTYLAKSMGLSDRHGGDISEFPFHLQRREFPQIVAA